jgi:hypothetical protein
VVFLGENVDTSAYHAAFHEAPPGAEAASTPAGAEGGPPDAPDELLPVTLGAIRGDERYPVHVVAADSTHPVTRYFEEHKESTSLHRPLISFSRYFEMRPRIEESPRFRVLFRYSDLEGTPAFFDNAYGKGRVLWMNTTADQAWNDFSNWFDFVVFLYESMSYLVSFGMEKTNLDVGEVFRRVYRSDEYASEVSLLMPEGDRDLGGSGESRHVGKSMRTTRGEAGAEGDEPGPGAVETFELTHEETFVPGLYRLDLRRPHTPRGDSVEYFCVNVDTAESDLRRLGEDDLKISFPKLKYQVLDVSERVREITSEQSALRGREFWKWFLGAVLSLMAVESILAWLFGRRSA